MTSDYIGYTRVSTTKQAKDSSSLDEQRGAIERYAAQHNLTITEWFEEHVTAAKQGRAQFAKMMAKLARGGARGVIIHKIDRSARNLRDWARLGELIDRGIDVRFAHESLDLASRGGRLAADIQAIVAADYVRNLKQEVRKGINGRLNQGIYPLPAPIGYKDEGKAKPKSIDPIKGPLVRKAFELYATGEYPLHALRAEMDRLGLRNRSGRPLSFQSLWHIIRNSFYSGVIHIARTGRSYPGIHPSIVPAALFERCQEIMSGRTYARTTKGQLIFSRFIRCKACSRSLIGERQKGHVYYRCHSTTCRGVSLREEDVKREVATFLSFLVLPEPELGDLRELREQLEGDAEGERARIVAEAKLGLGKCIDRLNRLTDLLVDGALDQNAFETRKTALLLERQHYQDMLDAPNNGSAELERARNIELGNAAILQAQTENWPDLRETATFTLSNLVADRKCLAFAPRFPFDEIAKQRCLMDGAPYRSEPRTYGAQITFVSASTPVEASNDDDEFCARLAA